jgi:hypothetical protein
MNTVNKTLRTYLEWRFKMNNIPKYLKYRDYWIDNIPKKQLWYYEIEMNHLKNRGVYAL